MPSNGGMTQAMGVCNPSYSCACHDPGQIGTVVTRRASRDNGSGGIGSSNESKPCRKKVDVNKTDGTPTYVKRWENPART